MGTVRKTPPALLFSALLHALLMAVFVVSATRSGVEPRTQTTVTYIEVEPLVRDADQTKNQVVQTETGTKTAKAAPDAYLGEQTQVVEKQTMSMPKLGTAPRTSQGAQAKANPKPLAEPEPPAKHALVGTGALAKFGISIPTGEGKAAPKKRNPIEEAALTAQARGEYVKGFKEGEQTMLNTREFVFYGYFQRIRERLDRAWEKSLRDRLAKYFYRGRQLASETDYVTQVMVSMDDSGRITRVQIIGASGTKDLDDAAIKAFNDAGPFPNPPRGLIDPEGQVLVRWDFVLKT